MQKIIALLVTALACSSFNPHAIAEVQDQSK